MSQSALSASFEHLCYGSANIIHILILSVMGPSSESDVYRRQILTYQDGSGLPASNDVKSIVYLRILHGQINFGKCVKKTRPGLKKQSEELMLKK